MKKILMLPIMAVAISGCSTLAGKTNMLSDEKIKSDASGALGYAPADITIVSRRTEGTNTYVAVKGSDGKEFNCIINGGNLLTMGMTNPPSCSKKGEPIKSSLFGG